MKEIKITGKVKLNENKSAELSVSVERTDNCEHEDVQTACKLFTDSLTERFDLDDIEIQATLAKSADDDDEPKPTKDIVSISNTTRKEAEDIVRKIFATKDLKEAVDELNSEMEIKLAAILTGTLGQVKQYLPEKKFNVMVAAIADTLNDKE